MHFESRYSRFNFDPVKYGAVIHYVIPQGLTFVAEKEGKIVGVFIGQVEEQFFGNDLAAWDLVQYVLPEYRGHVGPRLIREYIRRAKMFGIADINIGISTALEPERTGKLYECLGFHKVGGTYAMENK